MTNRERAFILVFIVLLCLIGYYNVRYRAELERKDGRILQLAGQVETQKLNNAIIGDQIVRTRNAQIDLNYKVDAAQVKQAELQKQLDALMAP